MNNNQKGQLLIEAMVAVSLMVIGMLGAFTVLSQSLGLNRVAADQYIATNLAAEGIEVVKNMVDYDYAEGLGFGTSVSGGVDSYCPIDYQSTELSSCDNAKPDLRTNDFIVKCQNCGGQSLPARYGSVGDQTKFVRYVVVQRPDLNTIRVGSVVEWKGRGGIDFSVELVDVFRNWRS